MAGFVLPWWAAQEEGLWRAAVAFGLAPAALVAEPLRQAPTLLTHAFLHGSWAHLLGNLVFLWVFGDNVEDRLGHLRFLAFYLLGAAVGALAHALVTPDPRVPLIGASGAISAVLGAYVRFFPTRRVQAVVVPLVLPWLALRVFVRRRPVLPVDAPRLVVPRLLGAGAGVGGRRAGSTSSAAASPGGPTSAASPSGWRWRRRSRGRGRGAPHGRGGGAEPPGRPAAGPGGVAGGLDQAVVAVVAQVDDADEVGVDVAEEVEGVPEGVHLDGGVLGRHRPQHVALGADDQGRLALGGLLLLDGQRGLAALSRSRCLKRLSWRSSLSATRSTAA